MQMATAPTATAATADAKTQNLTELEHVQNDSNVEVYHTIAAKAKLSALKSGDKSSQSLLQYLVSSNSGGAQTHTATVRKAKAGLLRELMKSGGDTTTRGFQLALEQLLVWSSLHDFDANVVPLESASDDGNATPKLEGTWITLSKPQFSDCQGVNENEDFLYTLGRMSFGKCYKMSIPSPVHCF